MVSNTISAGASISMVLPTVKTMSEVFRPKVSVTVDHDVILANSLEMVKREDIDMYIHPVQYSTDTLK